MNIVRIVKNVAKYCLILGLIDYIGGTYIVGTVKEFGKMVGGMIGHG